MSFLLLLLLPILLAQEAPITFYKAKLKGNSNNFGYLSRKIGASRVLPSVTSLTSQNLGMIMVCVAVIGLILFFTLDKNHAKYVNEVVESLMLLSMITASLWFYFSLYNLDVNPHPISFLDDLLLLICLPAFFTFCVLNAISGIGGERWFIPTNILSVRLSDQNSHSHLRNAFNLI